MMTSKTSNKKCNLNLPYLDYIFIHTQTLTEAKLKKFMGLKYFKAYNIITGEILYREIRYNQKLYRPESDNSYKYRQEVKNYSFTRKLSVPCVLELHKLKGFIRNMCNQKDFKYLYSEYDYIEVSMEEALCAFGLYECYISQTQLLGSANASNNLS